MKIVKVLCCMMILFSLLYCKSAISTPTEQTYKSIKIGKQNSRTNYAFLIDTLDFKTKIVKRIFSDDQEMSFDKIEICKGTTVGEDKPKEDFYFLKLQSFTYDVVTVRHLIKENNYYVLSDNSSFNLTYLTCVGKKGSCPPNIFISENNEKNWICSDDIRFCSPNKECDAYKTILLD